MSQKCPLCDSENTEHYTDSMEHIQLEDFLECKDCGYMYDEVTGSIRERIDGREFQWTYHDTEYNKEREKAAREYFKEARLKRGLCLD